MEENKKKGSGWGKAIIMFLIGVIIGLGTYYGYDNYLAKDSNNDQGENKVSKTVGDDVSLDVKLKLSRFVEAGSIDDSVTSSLVTAKYFNKGTTTISDEMKLKMVYNATLRYGEENHVIDKDEAATITTTFDKTSANNIVEESVTAILIENFDNDYKTFFGEKPKYTINDLKNLGCPSPWGISKEYGKIYLFHRCGGTSSMFYNSIIDYYAKDGDNYLVHTTGQVVDGTTDKVTTTYKTIWKFDKDLRFLSTEKE